MTIILALAAVAAAPAPAAPAPPPVFVVAVPEPPKPDPERLAAAREFLRVIGGERQMVESARQSTAVIAEGVLRSIEQREHQTLPPDLRETLLKVFTDHNVEVVERGKATMVEEMAAVYARRFTADELRELSRMQSNPVMAKLRQLSPELTTEALKVGIRNGAAHQGELRAKIEAALEAWRRLHASEDKRS